VPVLVSTSSPEITRASDRPTMARPAPTRAAGAEPAASSRVGVRAGAAAGGVPAASS
jgi:hypothetical protein